MAGGGEGGGSKDPSWTFEGKKEIERLTYGKLCIAWTTGIAKHFSYRIRLYHVSYIRTLKSFSCNQCNCVLSYISSLCFTSS